MTPIARLGESVVGFFTIHQTEILMAVCESQQFFEKIIDTRRHAGFYSRLATWKVAENTK
jgi:hypothetical protein